MKTTPFILLSLSCLVLASCASSSGRSSNSNSATNTSSAEKPKPSVLKLTAEETPAEVRAIEGRIDDSTVILASEAVIQVSKNYEMDVSLSGNDIIVEAVDPGGAILNVGRGQCTAFVRNLKIICEDGIRVQIADFGTKPFINVSARGHCSHIIPEANGSGHEIKRAQVVLIRNEKIEYLDQGIERVASTFSDRR